MPGKLLVTTYEKTAINRNDYVVITALLRPSKGTSRQGTLGSAKIQLLTKDHSLLEKMRRRFLERTARVLPAPQSDLGLGYLIGVRANIPKDFKEQLSIVGLTHIVAVSGYNLTILVQAVRRAFGRRSAYQSVLFAGFLITGFIAVTGGSAPIVRAAVVCGFSLSAWYYGRVIKPLLLLLLSGAITAFVNPLYIWGDPGWYLSFLAFAGVLILAPLLIKRYFYKKPPGVIKQILIESLCAQICTLPYTLYLFGGISIIAPVANVLVLPIIPFIMLAVFITGLIAVVFMPLALYVAVIPNALLSLQVWIIGALSKISGAYTDMHIDVITMILLFMLLTSSTVLLYGKTKRINSTQVLTKE